MAEKNAETAKETLRETIQLEREQIRDKIKELIDSEYARLEEEAARIAPGFDYEAETRRLKAEEAEELAKVDFEWAEEKSAKEEEKEKEKPRAAKKEPGPLPDAKVSRSKYPKSPYAPKTAAGRALLGDRHKRTLTAAAVLLVLFTAYQAWDYLVPKTVDISYITFEGTEHIAYSTTARTAGAVMEELAEEGSGFSPNDLLETNGDMPVSNDLEMSVRQASKASAKIAGEKQTLWLVPGTVAENLDLNGVVYDDDDEIKPALDEEVQEDTSIVVNEIHYDVVEKTEKVEAEDKVILDPSLTSGVQETTEGNDGEGVFTYTTKYVNGKDKGTEREVKEWITEPHDNVLRLGTSATGNSGEYIVTRTFTANTTAYTARSGAKGALGMGVHVGTCAVDPKFVSLRSELWIEGYGYAYANDTGGAVKNNVVDLYMNSNSQCIRWGRRNKTAYVIIPAE